MAATLTNETFQRLRAVSAQALAPLGERDVYQKMLRQVGDLMQAETTALVLRTGRVGAQSEWQLQASAGLDKELEEGLRSALRSPAGRRTMERLARSERPLVIRGWLKQETSGARLPEQGFALAGASLVTAQRGIGNLLVVTRQTRHFSQDELLLLQLIAERVTVGVGLAQLYQREQQARRQAEHSSRLRDEFLTTLSHEIRTPLNSILGWVSLLRAGRLSAEQAQQALATIERNARLQSQLVNNLVDLSALFNGKLDLDLQPVQPEALLAKVVESMRPAAEARQIELGSSFAATGKAAAGPLWADPDKLRQIVSHLLSNAIKFTPENGRVQVQLHRLEGWLEITVSDNGIGIRPEFLPFVFERFRQGDSSTTRSFGGLGVGLALVRQLVELHDGTVAVESAGEHKGTKFIVRLPWRSQPEEFRQKQQPLLELPEEIEEEVENEAQDLSGLQVLIVDDDFDSRALVSTILSHCHAEARTAAGSKEALAMWEAWQPDVLISDLSMLEMNGFELIRQVRARESLSKHKTLAIALTAHARAEDRLRVLTSGFQTHLPKPVAPAELLAVVASLTGRIGRRKNHHGAS
jgi:signal transduction histidine kinase/ActR/RegA family two-component response regulator